MCVEQKKNFYFEKYDMIVFFGFSRFLMLVSLDFGWFFASLLRIRIREAKKIRILPDPDPYH